jgi:hypothetical protein
MTTQEPCGNENCDSCYPTPRFKVSIERVQRIFYERTIKAKDAEEALHIVEQGTAWPTSYDDRGDEILEIKEPVVTVEDPPEFPDRCWNAPDRR